MSLKSTSHDTNIFAKTLPTVSCTTDIRSQLINVCEDDSAQQIIPLDAIGNFLVLLKSGKVKRIDERFDGSTCTIANYKRHVKLAYNQFFGSIIALDEQLVCARREYNGQFHMANMLTRVVDLENVFPVEFAVGEEMIWRCFLSSQDLQRAPEMKKFLMALNQRSTERRKSDFAAAIIDMNIMQMFVELNVLIAADRKRPPLNNDFASFSYAYLLLERLRLLLRPLKPYSPFDGRLSGKFRTDDVGDLMHITSSISKDVMNVEAARRLSFYRWPHKDFKYTSSSRMAEAGFYLQPNEGGDDKVMCFACSICLVSWEPDDDPYQEHERHSPNCKFLTAPHSSTNIPIAATMSSLAPLKWNVDIESQRKSNNCDKLIVGMMTRKSLWFTFADPLSFKPQITLFHLDKVAQAVNTLIVDTCDPFLSNAIGLKSPLPAPPQSLPPIETLTNVIVAAAQQRRVTWSDEPTVMTVEQQQPPLERILVLDQNISEEAFEDEGEEDMVSPGLIEDQEEELKQHQPSPHVSISPGNFNSRIVKITAICSAGVGNDPEPRDNCEDSMQHPFIDSSDNGEMAVGSSKITAVLFVGIAVDETNIQSNNRTMTEEINAMNVINSLTVNGDQFIDKTKNDARCPFLLVYHLAETLISDCEQQKLSTDIDKSKNQTKDEEPMEQIIIDDPNEERNKDYYFSNETAILLAETKKLQEQSTAFSAELVEFLNSEYPYKKPSLLSKYSNDSKLKTNENGSTTTEKIDNSNHVDSSYFDAPLQQSLNAENKVSILYEQRDVSTIIMQCFRLPDELDSSNFRIDHIVATENSNGCVVLGVNRVIDRGAMPDYSSSIVVYSRMEVVHMLQEICLRKYFFQNVKIVQILLLSIDYFAFYRLQKLNEEKSNNNRTSRHKENKQLLGSAAVRFSNGQVVLLDLNSGFSITIFDPTDSEDGQIASDIALCSTEGRSELDQIVVLTNKGRILCFDVKLPFFPVIGDERNEKIFFEMSNVLKAASSKSPIGEFQLKNELIEASSFLDGMLAVDNKTFSSSDSFDKLWSLTRLHGVSLPSASSCSTSPLLETSNWNSLLANEVQVHAPSNWIDTTLLRQRRSRRPTISTFTCSSTTLFMSDDKRGGEQQAKLQNTRTIWTFSRVEETTFPIAAANIYDQNLVFEFSMPPIMPVSHIEISLGSINHSSSDSSQQQIGGLLSIWHLDSDAIKRLFAKISNSSGSFSASHNKQMLLSLLGENPEHFVEENAKCVYGPIAVNELPYNLNRQMNAVRIRISSCALLLGAANLLNVDKAQTGWLNQSLHFFIHYKPPERVVNEGLNLYKTSTGKSLFLRQQQQTKLLERFGIYRSSGACDSIITPATVGSPLKRSHPGSVSDSNQSGTNSSPPFYYPASSVKSCVGSTSVPTLFSLRIHFCSIHGLD